MAEENNYPFKCHECGLRAAISRGFEVQINDVEAQCKYGQNPAGCSSLKEAAFIARQAAAIQGR
jgi:hypothetical protein